MGGGLDWKSVVMLDVGSESLIPTCSVELFVGEVLVVIRLVFCDGACTVEWRDEAIWELGIWFWIIENYVWKERLFYIAIRGCNSCD